MSEENIELMEIGRRATAAAGVVGNYIREQHGRIIESMVRSYKASTLTHDKLIGQVGELSALADLISNITSDQRRGNTAAEREHSG